MKNQLENVTEIESVVGQFYKALNAIFSGDTSQMTALWSHADDVTYLGPQGDILTGWQEVRSFWNVQADLKLGGKIEPRNIHFAKGGDIGISYNYEVGTNFINGQTERVNIRATNIFRKEQGKWKMIGHHTDLLPFLGNN